MTFQIPTAELNLRIQSYEQQMIDIGLKKYQQRISDVPNEKRILDATFRSIEFGIDQWKEVYLVHGQQNKRGKFPLWIYPISCLESKVLTWIAIHVVINEVRYGVNNWSTVSHAIGSHVIKQFLISDGLINPNVNPKIIQGIQRALKETNVIISSKAQSHALQYTHPLLKERFSDSYIKMQIGMFLLDTLIKFGRGWFLVSLDGTVRSKRTILINKDVLEYMKSREYEFSVPVAIPLVYPPKDWVFDEDHKVIGGGYHTITKSFIIKSGMGIDSQKPILISSLDVDATNVLQRTEWSLNVPIVKIIRKCVDNGVPIAGLPLDDLEAIRSRDYIDDELYRKLSLDEKRDISARHRRNNKIANKISKHQKVLLDTLRSIRTLQTNGLGSRVIYFPVRADFRLRRYMIGSGLNPLLTKLARSILQFNRSVPLGSDGFNWLKLKLASTAGYTNMSFRERLEWVHTNHDNIMSSGQKPLETPFWSNKEHISDPWGFLATCMEYYRAVNSGNPQSFKSNAVISIDGSSNGLQHLAILMRDEALAKLTNCSSQKTNGELRRSDLYQFIANDVNKQLSHMRHQFKSLVFPFDHVTRDIVKPATMCFGYGLTKYGMKDLLLDEDIVDTIDQVNFLGDIIWRSFQEYLPGLFVVKRFLTECVKLLVQKKEPMVWETPLGSILTQRYFQLKHREVTTVFGSYRPKNVRGICYSSGEAFSSKQLTAITPNFIHSYDAAHLALSVMTAHETYGLKDFMVIHDSFGTHAGNMTNFKSVINQSMRKIHEIPALIFLKKFLTLRFRGIIFPDVPKVGTFDINEVNNADYMFN